MPSSARRDRVGGPDLGHLPGLRVLAMAAVSIALVGLSGGVAGGTARGRTLWFAAYDGPANGLDAAEGIAASGRVEGLRHRGELGRLDRFRLGHDRVRRGNRSPALDGAVQRPGERSR